MLKIFSKGFSLIEVTIVLVVIGILALFSIQFISKIGTQALNQQFKNDLERANYAVTGFIYANNRLPCPDTNNDGIEDCATNNREGSLPLETLGIESSIQKKQGGQIRYGVFRKANATLALDNDLAQSKDRYEPLLPNSEVSSQINGLDFCLALKSASMSGSDNSQLNIGTLGINVAYVIADSGTIDANNDNILFDGSNGAGVKFEKPNKPHLNNYDDNVLAVGFNELSGRLNCALVLAETNGAARASFASYDMWRIATVYKDYRDFNVDYLRSLVVVATSARDLAAAAVAISGLGVLLGIANAILDLTGASVVGIALAAIAAVDAAYALVQAISGLTSAEAAVVAGQLQQTQAIAALAKSLTFKDFKLATVKTLDQRGLIR
jgi:prepilin-type N-terminal cleavage/methylation domain-containing protein